MMRSNRIVQHNKIRDVRKSWGLLSGFTKPGADLDWIAHDSGLFIEEDLWNKDCAIGIESGIRIYCDSSIRIDRVSRAEHDCKPIMEVIVDLVSGLTVDLIVK